MSFKPEVFVEGKWSHNALVFRTYEEALASAKSTFSSWFACDDYRAVESDETPNYTIENGVMRHLTDAEMSGNIESKGE